MIFHFTKASGAGCKTNSVRPQTSHLFCAIDSGGHSCSQSMFEDGMSRTHYQVLDDP